jgi:hypothetical protein
MLHLIEFAQPPADYPLSLAERLINLAADAGDAGFPVAAEHLTISRTRYLIDLWSFALDVKPHRIGHWPLR